MVKPGIDLCERVVGSDKAPYGFLYRCTTGAYNALEVLSQDPKYKLQKLTVDPYGFCETQKDEYREGCYVNMMPAARRLDGSDFAKSAKRIAQIPEGAATGWKRRSQVLQALSHEYVHDHLAELSVDANPAARFCRSVDQNLQQSCFEGLGGGFMKYGKPEVEYQEAFHFCSSSVLTAGEKQHCYGYVLPRLRNWYSASKTAAVCGEVPAEYQKMCVR
jgi:hypothetical protein